MTRSASRRVFRHNRTRAHDLTKRTLLAALACTLASTFPNTSRADLRATPAISIGPSSGPGKTTAFGAGGMDLGIPWTDALSRTQTIFGDTSGAVNKLCGSPRISLNAAVAWTTDRTLPDGINYSGMISRLDPYFEHNFAPALNSSFSTHTIPNGAAAAGALDLVHFTSVAISSETLDGFKCPKPNLGSWYSFIATRHATTAAQEQFTESPAFGSWGADSNFAQGSLLHKGDYLYMFGITTGRNGGVKLARAWSPVGTTPTGLIWSYWNGRMWTDTESSAAFIIPPPVGELSASYIPSLGRFVLTYFDGLTEGIVFRDAQSPEGSWSEQKTLVRQADSPGLYGSYIYPPDSTGDTSSNLYFNMSNWRFGPGPFDPEAGPDPCIDSVFYNTHIRRSTLTFNPPSQSSARGEIVSDPAFGRYLCTSTIAKPCPPHGVSELSKELTIADGAWVPIPLTHSYCGVPDTDCKGRLDRNPEVTVERSFVNGPARVKLMGSSGWRGISQRIAVRPWSDYTIDLSGSWNNAAGYVGVHGVVGPHFAVSGTTCYGISWSNEPINEEYLGTSSASTSRTLTFNSGPYSLVDVFGGFVGLGSPGQMIINSLSMRQFDVVSDGGFEMQPYEWTPSATVHAPFLEEGDGPKRVWKDWGFPGAALEISSQAPNEWNAVTQLVSVSPGTYQMRADVAGAGDFNVGFLGVRRMDGTILAETSFPQDSFYQDRSVTFIVDTPGESQLRLFVGYWSGSTAASWSNLLVDNISMGRLTP